VNTKKVSSESLKATLESGGFKIIKIHPTTKVDPSAHIGPNVVIAKWAVLGSVYI